MVLLAVLARQIMLIVDNEQLRQSLERRVIERTRSLRKVAQQSDLLVNSVGDGIYGVDRDGVVTFVNPAAARVLGYPPHELIGREAHATFHDLQPDGTPVPGQHLLCHRGDPGPADRPAPKRTATAGPTGCPCRSRSPRPR